MVSGVYEAEADRGVIQETLESVENAAERAGKVAKAAWTEAEPSLKEAGKSAEKAATEFAEGMKRFGRVVVGRGPEGADVGSPPPPAPAAPSESPEEPEGGETTSQEQ
jgi:hypothetical protein